jgi:hypothetical protein
MIVDLTKSFCIILHLEKAIDRLENIEKITEKIPNYKIWLADDINTYDSNKRNKLLDLKFYHRIPNKFENKEEVLKRCSCTLHHLDILKFIIDNKLNNVIVFEDDAFNEKNNFTINIDDDTTYYYLGFKLYKQNNKIKFAGQHAIYYPKFEYVENIYNVLKDPKKLKCIDYMFSNYIQPKFKHQYSNFFIQSGLSLVNNCNQEKEYLKNFDKLILEYEKNNHSV